MEDYTYSVLDINEMPIASGMRLEDALILVKALMLEYYGDPMTNYTISRNSIRSNTNG